MAELECKQDQRILILAPIGRDEELTARFLREAGLRCKVCANMRDLCDETVVGCGCLLLTEEVLQPETVSCLLDELQHQARWSDLPLVILTSGGCEVPASADVTAKLTETANVTLIERPVRPSTLLSAVKAALRARLRQYEVRDHLIEEVRAKEALSRSEQRLRVALDAGELGAWQLDFRTGQLTCTPQCKANFGLPDHADFDYDALLAMIHPDDRSNRAQALERAIREQDIYRGEYRLIWPDGSLHWILVSGRANYDDSGRALDMTGVTLDITKRKLAEEERERLLQREQAARAEAEAANRLKDEFLATVSHELRTPLTAILGWAEMLRADSEDEEVLASGMEVIERNARSQAKLIDDLLDVSRVINGKMRLEVQPLELGVVIDAAVDAMRPAADAKNIQLEITSDGAPAPLYGDASRLQQVIWNLLTNAVKFTPTGGNIRVHSQHLDSHVEIAVTDSGIGIAPEFLPHVFDRFRQADQTSTRTHGGLGLGLSIVRHIVELHGGTVGADSPGKNQGSTFTVRLPLPVSQQVSPNSAADPDAEYPSANDQRESSIEGPNESTSSSPSGRGYVPREDALTGLRVLVVDDEVDTRSMLRTMLELHGSVVATAGSVAEALQIFEQRKPDLVVSDIGMPEQDGYFLIRRLRELENGGSRTPAIALTAYVREDDRSRALSAGYQVHLSKPIDARHFVSVVAEVAGREYS